MPGDTVNDMILRVHLSNKPDNITEIPINPDTTCKDVVEMCKEPGEEHYHLAQHVMGAERAIGSEELISDILGRLGPRRKDARFYFRHNNPPTDMQPQDNGPKNYSNVKGGPGSENMIANDVDLSLSELQDMASWQQQQIGNQQQLLVAKQQRLKFLKQQELSHQRDLEENEQLKKLKEKVDAQENKLKRLRAVQGQVESTKVSNDSLSELESVKALFAEKERELAKCLTKVEEMTNQLKQMQHNPQPNGSYRKPDIERLRQELLNHNSRNEQQSTQLETQASLVNQRSQRLRDVDKRILELKELLHQQRAAQNNSTQQLRTNNNSRNVSSGGNSRGRAVSQRAVPPDNTAPVDHRHRGFHPRGGGYYDGGQNGGRMSLPNGVLPPDGNGPRGKPVAMSGGRTGEGIPSPNQRFSPSPRSSPQQNHRPVPVPRRPPDRGRDDNSGSDTSSLTENSSLDSIPGVTGMPRQRPLSGPNNRRMSPVQNTRNIGGYSEERNRSPIPRPGQNRSLAARDPHTAHLQTRAAGDRSPIMYSPVSPTATTPWPQNDPGYDSSSQIDGPPLREPIRNISSVPHHQPSPPVQRPIPAQRPKQFTANGPSSRGPTNPSVQNGSSRKPPIASPRASPSTVIPGNEQGSSDDKDQDSELSSELSQQDEGNAAISAERPASPIRDPTLVVQFLLNKDANRVHNMPRPLRKRMSLTESKDGDYSFMKPEHHKRLFGPGQHAKENLAHKSDLDKKAEEPPETKAPGDEYSNDAVLTHKQYKEALAMLSQSQILSQTTTRAGPHGILKREGKSRRKGVRVRFDPLALLLDASLEGEYDQVRRIIQEVPNPSDANDEGITALHNAICANHSKIVNFLIVFGVDVNSPDSDGWTPLHCAASCNNLKMVKMLVEHGACVFATTISDKETPAEKCEKEEDGYLGCFEYLNDIQEKMGSVNNGTIYGVYNYEAEKEDELDFKDGDQITVVKKENDEETEWWWASKDGKEGYIPRNLVAMYPRVKPLFN